MPDKSWSNDYKDFYELYESEPPALRKLSHHIGAYGWFNNAFNELKTRVRDLARKTGYIR